MVIKATSRYHELHACRRPPSARSSWLPCSSTGCRACRLWQSTPFRVAVAGLMLMFVVGPYVAHFAMLSARGAASPLGCYSSLPRASCIPIGKDQEQAADFLRTHSQPGEPIFVGTFVRRQDLRQRFIDRFPGRTAQRHVLRRTASRAGDDAARAAGYRGGVGAENVNGWRS